MPISENPMRIKERNSDKKICPLMKEMCHTSDCMMWIEIETTDMDGNVIGWCGGRCGLVSFPLHKFSPNLSCSPD